MPLKAMKNSQRRHELMGRAAKLLLGQFCIVLFCAVPAFGDWPQFRGPNSSGIAPGASPPVEFGPGRNELWKVPMVAGHSSPIVVGDVIFLTTWDKEKRKLAVVCLSRLSGKIRWQGDVPATKFEKGHASFNPASSTAASDGERVVAYFGSFGLICFDMEGKLTWKKNLQIQAIHYCRWNK